MSVRVIDPIRTGAPDERDLLAQLGLGAGASNDQVEAAHDAILDFLDHSPSSLRAWARRAVIAADEAYARLNGAPPSADIAPSVVASGARAAGAAAVTAGGGLDDLDGFYDRDDDKPRITVRAERRTTRIQAEREGRARHPESGTVILDRRALRRGAIGAAVVLALVVGGFWIYQLGGTAIPGITGSPAPAASGGLDTAAVSADMQKLAANANDIDTLQDLANLYYAAGDYATAQTWLDKILALDPKNIAALLGYGAAAYNVGDLATAEAKWQAAVAVDPNNIEAHYDLGFMYFSQTPPNVEGVKAEWNAVLTLNPDSDLKTYIEAHLASLDALSSGQPSSAPAGSTAPGGSPAPSGSPAAPASPASSPAAS